MRIDYTLPALQPGTLPGAPTMSEEGGLPFRALVRSEAVRLPETVDQQLRLDARPFTGTYIGPPPRPRTLDIRDAETQRSRWRNMLLQHGSVTAGLGGTSPGASGRQVQTMLRMLKEMQQLEDSIVAQSVAVTRG